MKCFKHLALAAIASVSLSANAGLLSISGGTDVLVPSVNKFVYDGTTSFNVGGDLYLTKDANITFTYLAKEAGYGNTFEAYANSVNTKVDSYGTSFSVANVLAGLIDFTFSTDATYSNGVHVVADLGSVANGANVYDELGNDHSFAILLDYTYKGTFYDAVLLFDDTGTGKLVDGTIYFDDDNHDDMLIGLNAVAVPVPATILLLGLGLIGLGASRRRS